MTNNTFLLFDMNLIYINIYFSNFLFEQQQQRQHYNPFLMNLNVYNYNNYIYLRSIIVCV